MFTRFQNPAFVVLSLGLVSIGHSPNRQSVTDSDKPSGDTTIELSYHVKAIQRDSSGQYTMSGTVNGEVQGKATLMFGFDQGSSGQAGKTPVHSSWVVTAVAGSETFKGKMSGTGGAGSGANPPVGKNTPGAHKGAPGGNHSR